MILLPPDQGMGDRKLSGLVSFYFGHILADLTWNRLLTFIQPLSFTPARSEGVFFFDHLCYLASTKMEY
jgi:hypothetical protein